MKEIILASQSPRRKELLEEVGLRFRVEPAQIEEHLDESLPITQAIEQLAKEKAMPIARRHPQCIVIGADTLVAVDGLVLASRRMRRMPHACCGCSAAVAIRSSAASRCSAAMRKCCFTASARCASFPLREEEIAAYIRSGEPMDKAGAYGIQGLGRLFVESICGDYFNIVGLPVSRLMRALDQFS